MPLYNSCNTSVAIQQLEKGYTHSDMLPVRILRHSAIAVGNKPAYDIYGNHWYDGTDRHDGQECNCTCR